MLQKSKNLYSIGLTEYDRIAAELIRVSITAGGAARLSTGDLFIGKRIFSFAYSLNVFHNAEFCVRCFSLFLNVAPSVSL